MADRYIFHGPWNNLWACDEQGNPVEELGHACFNVKNELNRLARLADDAANLARLDERTKVAHELLKENLDKPLIASMVEKDPGNEQLAYYQRIELHAQVWNRIVRALKGVTGVIWP